MQWTNQRIHLLSSMSKSAWSEQNLHCAWCLNIARRGGLRLGMGLLWWNLGIILILSDCARCVKMSSCNARQQLCTKEKSMPYVQKESSHSKSKMMLIMLIGHQGKLKPIFVFDSQVYVMISANCQSIHLSVSSKNLHIGVFSAVIRIKDLSFFAWCSPPWCSPFIPVWLTSPWTGVTARSERWTWKFSFLGKFWSNWVKYDCYIHEEDYVQNTLVCILGR